MRRRLNAALGVGQHLFGWLRAGVELVAVPGIRAERGVWQARNHISRVPVSSSVSCRCAGNQSSAFGLVAISAMVLRSFVVWLRVRRASWFGRVRAPAVRFVRACYPCSAIWFYASPMHRAVFARSSASGSCSLRQRVRAPNYAFKPTAVGVLRFNQPLPCGGGLTRR